MVLDTAHEIEILKARRDQELRHDRQFGATEVRLRDLVRQDGQYTYVARLGARSGRTRSRRGA
ncbi:BZ3500_MvSof-1268-A1-R1_Chr10-3g03079 [Microbotryum saponariae]|uniref:BZ3500_MvSof-1268-A1-R1_Chr10-3g03079 protein n=1 Tax=Microbotryum saponariae TaxID=289078 RepID=A0A2X0M3K3_9BASI|nr:BZ3501_MvSof-1269-A2-R1_Chr10-2g02657 [Microbotryum saponariae]SDA02111.1 BZ3500_MvSof-1268-A1-R1_Chr10-3g03079 [Microbotryum saponariae]